MRFCCIIENKWINNVSKEETTGPKRGDIVTKTEEYGYNGILYYKFKEWPKNEGFVANQFIPINEPAEEDEMKEVTFTEMKKDVPVSSN